MGQWRIFHIFSVQEETESWNYVRSNLGLQVIQKVYLMFNSVSSIIFYIVFNVVIQSISMNDGAVKWQPSSKQYSFIKPHQGKKIYIAHPTFFPPQPFFLTFSHCTAMVAQDASPYGQAGTALYHHMVTMTSCAPVTMANKTTMSCQTCHEKPTQILVLMGD